MEDTYTTDTNTDDTNTVDKDKFADDMAWVKRKILDHCKEIVIDTTFATPKDLKDVSSILVQLNQVDDLSSGAGKRLTAILLKIQDDV